MTVLHLGGASLPDGSRVDVTVRGTVVERVAPAGTTAPGDAVVEDLDGFLLLPAPAEPHTHLDKALTWDAAGGGYGDLPAAVACWSAYSSTLTAFDVRARARHVLAELLAAGATAVRTHANACSGADPLLALRALVALREEMRGRVTVQVVFLSRPDLPDAVLREALGCGAGLLGGADGLGGADLLGGAPHLAPDPSAEHRRLLALAADAGVGLDLHTDEVLDSSARGLAELAALVETGFPHPVTASHCVSLGLQSGADLAATVEAVRRAGIGVVTLPATNLHLQGRGAATSPPRGLTAVRALLDAGVPVAGGGDNVRDPFLPLGRADPLEAAALLVTAGHLTVEEAYAAVSTGARRVMGLPPAGPARGLAAELLAVRADSLADALARAPADRVVVSGGRVVARSRTARTTVLDDG